MAGNIPRLSPMNLSSHPNSMLQSPRITSSSLPIREQLDIDPLLANLSPSSVLEALRTNDATLAASASKEQLLADSISEASSHERALGIRAALAGKRIRDWTVELQAWTWPEQTFQPPIEDPQDEYWGSLPSKVVLEREDRLEEIKDGLVLLETEGLKNYVRNIHLQAPTRKVSQGSPGSTSYNHLADFNVLITAIIVQSLPDLAILTRLISRWSLRISVLKQIPKFLQQLWEAKLGLESAWITLEQATRPDIGLGLTKETYDYLKQMLEDRVTELAKSIDAILDALEGQEDSIPDQWIDDVEEAESELKDWIIEAERLVRLYEWQAPKLGQDIDPIAPVSEQITNHDPDPVSITGALATPFNENDDTSVKTRLLPVQPLHAVQEVHLELTSNMSGLTSDGFTNMTQELGVSEDVTKQTPSSMTNQSLFLNSHPAASANLEVNDRSAILQPTTDADSLSDIIQEFTQLSSPTNNDTTNNHAVYHTADKLEGMPSILSKNHDTIDQSAQKSHVSDLDLSPRSSTSSLHSRSMVHDNRIDETQQSAVQTFTPEFSAQQQVDDIQQEFDDYAVKDLDFVDQSPSLMVRKVRLPLEKHTTVDDSLDDVEHVTAGQPIEDKMTAKISRLLTNIPAPIQLAIHPPRVGTGTGVEGRSVSRPQSHSISTPALTLSPATTKAKSIKSNDLGIQVYHLHQAGRAMPIKLLIRLVGSEERVMVRVGGGWADLAEYLKEYAIHHGRRSVSNNHFELDGHLSAQNAANSILGANRSPSSSTTGTPTRRPTTPQTDWSFEPYTPDSVRQAESTPASDDSRRYHLRSNSSTLDDEALSLGLGGPKSKKIELSPQKRAWVDGMLGQARQISSEYRKTDDMGDLGKVGNTKRVFLRSRGDSFTPK